MPYSEFQGLLADTISHSAHMRRRTAPLPALVAAMDSERAHSGRQLAMTPAASIIPHPQRGDEGGLGDVALAELAHPLCPLCFFRIMPISVADRESNHVGQPNGQSASLHRRIRARR